MTRRQVQISEISSLFHQLRRRGRGLLPSTFCQLPTAFRPLPSAHRLLSTALCLLLSAFCLLPSACFKRGAQLEQAQVAWDNGDYATAAARCEEFLREHPQDGQTAATRFRVANIYYYNLKQFDRAIQHYIHLLEDFPQSPDVPQARLRIAECYAAAGKKREAITTYENLLAQAASPEDKRRARLNIADLYYELNDLGQAVAEYQKVTTEGGYDELAERAYLRVGGIRLLRDEFEEAIPAYQMVAQNTKDPGLRRVARYGLVDCYERTFKYDEAVRILEQTEPDPKTPNYIQQRTASIREQQRQRQISQPPGGFPRARR